MHCNTVNGLSMYDSRFQAPVNFQQMQLRNIDGLGAEDLEEKELWLVKIPTDVRLKKLLLSLYVHSFFVFLFILYPLRSIPLSFFLILV